MILQHICHEISLLCSKAVTAYVVEVQARIGNRGAKKGAHVLLPPKIFTFSDAEFNVDYDFAIKHNLV